MTIRRDEVLHVAKLAELAVPESELERLVEQLNRIVDYVAQLDEVPADHMAEPFLAGPFPAQRSERTSKVQCPWPAPRWSWHPSSETASSWYPGTVPWRTQ